MKQTKRFTATESITAAKDISRVHLAVGNESGRVVTQLFKKTNHKFVKIGETSPMSKETAKRMVARMRMVTNVSKVNKFSLIPNKPLTDDLLR